MAERAIKNRFALLQSTTASSVIEGVRPHVSCATYDIRQLADEIASLFAAKGSMIEEGDVTLTDVSGLLDEIAEFEKESMGFCADVRQAIRKLMAGRAISETIGGAETVLTNRSPRLSQIRDGKNLLPAISRFISQRRVNEVLTRTVEVINNSSSAASLSLSSGRSTTASSVALSVKHVNNDLDRPEPPSSPDLRLNLQPENLVEAPLITESARIVQEFTISFAEYMSQQNVLFAQAVEDATRIISEKTVKALRGGGDGMVIDTEQRNKIRDAKQTALESVNTAYQTEMGGLAEGLRGIFEAEGLVAQGSTLDDAKTEAKRRLLHFKVALVKVHTQMKDGLSKADSPLPQIESTSVDDRLQFMTVSPHIRRQHGNNQERNRRSKSELQFMSAPRLLAFFQAERMRESCLARVARAYRRCSQQMLDRMECKQMTGYKDKFERIRHFRTPNKLLSTYLGRFKVWITYQEDEVMIQHGMMITITSLQKICGKSIRTWRFQMSRSRENFEDELQGTIANAQEDVRAKIDEIKERAEEWLLQARIIVTERWGVQNLAEFESCYGEVVSDYLAFIEMVAARYRPSVAWSPSAAKAKENAEKIVSKLDKKFLNCSSRVRKSRDWNLIDSLKRALGLLWELPVVCAQDERLDYDWSPESRSERFYYPQYYIWEAEFAKCDGCDGMIISSDWHNRPVRSWRREQDKFVGRYVYV